MIFFHFSKVRRFFSLKEAILDPKCKTKKLNIALNFHYQKSLHLYDVPVRRNSIFRAEGRKFSMSVLWRKKFDNIDFFIFLATDPIFRQFWFSLLISLKDCLYLMCVKAENFSWLLRVARAKTIGRVVFTPPPREISWQARPREIGLIFLPSDIPLYTLFWALFLPLRLGVV